MLVEAIAQSKPLLIALDDLHWADTASLELVTELSVPGAHGAGMTHNGKVFYTTNLPGGGTDGLFAIDRSADHGDVRLFLQQTAQSFPESGVVIRDDDPRL